MTQRQNSKQIEDEQYKFEHRPQLDGLRAISVIGVIQYHLPERFSIFKYGSIGVQIFFVISGYLITGVILRDLTRNKFTLQAFYERRLKRIMPNILLCCFVNVLIASYYDLHEARQLGKTTLASLLMIKNFAPSLLQSHFWSLAVQQQFYLLWPLFVPYLLKKSFKKQMVILATIGIISAIFFIIIIRVLLVGNPGKWIISKAWNLMLGCIICFIQYHNQKMQRLKTNFKQVQSQFLNQLSNVKDNQQKKLAVSRQGQQANNFNKHIVNIVTIIILIVLILLMRVGFEFMEENWFKSSLEIDCAILACILIHLRGTYASYILSFRILRFIGRQSYTIYVWHYSYIYFISSDKVDKWLKGPIFIFPLACCYFQDKITNSKSKATVIWIICLFMIMVTSMATLALAGCD